MVVSIQGKHSSVFTYYNREFTNMNSRLHRTVSNAKDFVKIIELRKIMSNVRRQLPTANVQELLHIWIRKVIKKQAAGIQEFKSEHIDALIDFLPVDRVSNRCGTSTHFVVYG